MNIKEINLVCDKCGGKIYYDINHDFHFCRKCGLVLSTTHLKKDDKINEINQKINKYSEYVKLHPEKMGVKGNIKTLTHVREKINQRK